MLFQSIDFLFLFLPSIFFIYFFVSKHLSSISKYILIFAGIYFYSKWNIYHTPAIILSILVNYYISYQIVLTKKQKVKKRLLIYSIFFNIILLAFLKYSDFIILNINFLFNSNINKLNLPFPLAFSFVTFQTINYLVNCFDNEIKNVNFKNYFLFIIFFPQLIAGPIVKYNFMINQFDNLKNRYINKNNIIIGLILIFIGLFKKVIIADTLALNVDKNFLNYNQLELFSSWITSTSFTFQIYFDFSGYIDIATGIALLFNIRLPQNFNSPYKAVNMIDFWKRWHITLSNFLMNFIYYPWIKCIKNLDFFKSMLVTFAVFIIAGIWHGPSWLFIIFGALHGVGIVFNHIYNKLNLNMNKFLSIFLTFNYINLTFVFFRAENIESALGVIKSMFFFSGVNIYIIKNLDINSLIIFFISILIIFYFKNSNYLLDSYLKTKNEN